MTDFQQQKLALTLPFKSVAGALLFSVLLGPVGLLYASVLSGTLMILLAFWAVGHRLVGVLILLWVVSCILSVAATNRYNKKIIRERGSARI